LDNLLKACAYLPGELQPNLLVIGDGPAHTQLEEMSHVVYPRARFLGAKHGPDLDAFFKKADLFVLPGTGGLAIQHAMSYGLPIIVAQGDGTQEDLVRPGNGWLVPPDNLEALSRALLEALSHPHRLRTMGAESYRIASEEINLDTMVDAFVEVLNRVG
jgi:glycosyltransferase involved in cell wall biosynthesis